MKTFLPAFLGRLVCWWLPLSLPWCILFFGSVSHIEADAWLTEANISRLVRSLVAGLQFTLPVALFAAIAHTAAIYRKTIFSANKVKPKEYQELPDLTDDMFARARLQIEAEGRACQNPAN